MKNTISILVPAYNEEKKLATTVSMISGIVKSMFIDYEILIFDDCSTDKTGLIADELAKKNHKIKAIHNKRNMGLGYNFRQGAKIAQKEYYCSISADHDAAHSSFKKILGSAGKADLILSFIADDDRPLYRRIISKGFTIILNFLFGLHLKYYCGIIVYKTKSLKKVKMRTNSFAMNAEVIVPLIKKGNSYIQLPYTSTEKGKTKGSNLFRLKNLIGVLVTIIRLFFEVGIKKPNLLLLCC